METVKEVKDYLQNYKKTYSTTMDEHLGMFKSDAYILSEEYRKGYILVDDRAGMLDELTDYVLETLTDLKNGHGMANECNYFVGLVETVADSDASIFILNLDMEIIEVKN